jgi:hypothetical protein
VWYDSEWLTETAKNFSPESILCYYFPSSLWIVLPFLSMILIGKRFVKAVSEKGEKEKAKQKTKSA